MDTKKLRQKILDLAIRGKLVPQDPNDEPASVLLERIRAEKERLIKEGKIKQSKKTALDARFKNINFVIPQNWELSTLAEVFYMHAGKFISASLISSIKDDEYCYQCIGGNGIRGYVKTCNTEGMYPIIGRQGALCGNINFATGHFFATEHAVVVDTFCNISERWAYYFLINLNLNQYATATAQPGLSVNTIGDVQIPVPPINEQKRIVDAIEQWYDLIDELESNEGDLLKIIDQAKSKILDLAIHGKLVSQDPNDEPAIELLKRINPKFEPCDNKDFPFEIPQSWEWSTLGEISNYGNTVNVDVQDIFKDAWVLELEDLEKDSAKIINRITKGEREIKGVRHHFQKGNVLYSKLRTYLNKVLVAPEDGYCTTEIMPICFYSHVQSSYINHVLRSKYFLDYTIQCGYGVKMPRLSTSDARKGLIPLPPLNEQLRIVAKIEELFAVLDSIKESLE